MKTYKNIKAIGLFLFLSTLVIQNIYGQKEIIKQMELKAGLGLLPTYFKDKPDNIIPPLSLGVQYHFTQKFSIEAYTAHSRSRSE